MRWINKVVAHREEDKQQGNSLLHLATQTATYRLLAGYHFLFVSLCRLCLLPQPAPPAGQLRPWREGHPAGVWAVHRQAGQGPAAGRWHSGRCELQEETLWVLLQVHLLHHTRLFSHLIHASTFNCLRLVKLTLQYSHIKYKDHLYTEWKFS